MSLEICWSQLELFANLHEFLHVARESPEVSINYSFQSKRKAEEIPFVFFNRTNLEFHQIIFLGKEISLQILRLMAYLNWCSTGATTSPSCRRTIQHPAVDRGVGQMLVFFRIKLA